MAGFIQKDKNNKGLFTASSDSMTHTKYQEVAKRVLVWHFYKKDQAVTLLK